MIGLQRVGRSDAAKRIAQAGMAFAADQAAAADRRREMCIVRERLAAGDPDTVRDWVARQREIWTRRQPEVVIPQFVPPWRRILGEVCDQHGVSIDDVVSASRKQDLTIPRFEACYRMLAETALSLSEIGSKLNRDHTTVHHAVRAHARRNGLALPRQDDGRDLAINDAILDDREE